MSYVQIQLQDGFITRSPTLAPSARMDGYPGYMVQTQADRGLVRTILWEDETGIYLTKRKRFILTANEGGNLIFSSNPEAEPVVPEGRRYPWFEEWANMANSRSDRSNLVHPFIDPADAWDLIAMRRYKLTLGNITYTHPCNIFRCEDYGYFVYGSSPAVFQLKKYGSEYGLTYDDVGRTIGAGGTRDVKCWNEGTACRWMIHGGTSGSYPIVKFKPRHQGNGAYHLHMGTKSLSTSGSWFIRSLLITLDRGVEFYTAPPAIVIPMVRGVSSSDMYRIGTFLRYTGSFNRMGVSENLPDGSSCPGLFWDGSNLSCYMENVPYSYDTGLTQCTSLDDLKNDKHCQIWATSNAGPSMDDMLRSMCKDQEAGGPYADVCDCYLPDEVYYDIILRESGERVANGVRASSLLQCASGICSGAGTIGEDIFYSGSRKCDVCIQVMTANINADKIHGGITLRQQCTHVDATYTWDQLMDDLLMYGAYHQNEGIHRHVIINDARSAIMLVGTPGTPLLLNLAKDGRVIVTKDEWLKSPTALSNEILAFFVESRM